MKHLVTIIFVLLTILAIASCGTTSSNPTLNSEKDDSQNPAACPLDCSQMPAFPLDEKAAKAASWTSNPDHLTPYLSLNGGIDPLDPSCYLLQGIKYNFGAAPFKQIAVAIYQIPLGATEPDLLEMKVAAQVGAPGQQYYAAIANFSAMAWQFYGPSSAPTWVTNMTSLGYDFTGPAGNMYIALIALPGEQLHITDITLKFKDADDPTWWNVWGEAYESYAFGSPHAGYTVSFENLGTGVTYTTTTAANGHWGMNLPEGHYKFGVDSNEMLLDVSGPPTLIDYIYDVSGFGIKMDLTNTGEFVYLDDNAAYIGSVVPMPLITANSY